MVSVIITRGSRKLKTEVKCLEDEVMILKVAIEEAILKGQKSLDLVSDIPDSDVVFDKDFAVTCADAVPGVVGWVDDF